jgi:hypothetical protein
VVRFLAAIAALAACGSPSTPESPPKPSPRVRLDAGVPGVTTIHGYDPASGLHLDEGGGERRPASPAVAHGSRPIDITLRSTPPGAEVAVDGEVIGTTPTYWPGQADGHEHEFTFALARHAIARFRFVPVTSGVIHPRLEPIAEEPDGGVPDEPALEPAPVPEERPIPVPPPPTVITPDAASAPRTDIPQ